MTQNASEPPLPSLDQMQDILDIEGILRFPWSQIFLFAGLALALIQLCLVLFILIGWWKRRKIQNREEELLPHEKAFLEIKKLEQQKLLEKEEYRKYYFFLSEILRRYLQELFSYPAIDKTTPEILPDLAALFSGHPECAQQASDFLARADYVKFADFKPEAEQGRRDKEIVVNIVRQTMEKKVARNQ